MTKFLLLITLNLLVTSAFAFNQIDTESIQSLSTSSAEDIYESIRIQAKGKETFAVDNYYEGAVISKKEVGNLSCTKRKIRKPLIDVFGMYKDTNKNFDYECTLK